MSENNGTEYNHIEATNVAKVKEEEIKEVEQKPERKKPLTSGVIKKKSLFGRIADLTVSKQGAKSIGTYVAREIVGPSIRDMFASGLKTAIDMVFYRDGGVPQSYNRINNHSTYRNNRVNYVNYSGTSNRQYHNQNINYAPSESLVDVGVYVIPDRAEAVNVQRSTCRH